MTELEKLAKWVEEECTERHNRVMQALQAAYDLGWQENEDLWLDE